MTNSPEGDVQDTPQSLFKRFRGKNPLLEFSTDSRNNSYKFPFLMTSSQKLYKIIHIIVFYLYDFYILVVF